MLDIQILPHATTTVLQLTGELTASGAGLVRLATSRIRRGERLVVDLEGVRDVDRPGLAALVALLVKARSKATSVGVRCDIPKVVDLLHREGIDRIVPLQPSVAG